MEPRVKQSKKQGLAITALVLGLCSFVCFPLGIFAIVFGIIALVKAMKRPDVFGGQWLAGVGLGMGCIFMLLGGIIAAIAIPNFMNAVNRGKQKRTMADIRSIGVAWESFAVDNARYAPDDSDSRTFEWGNITYTELSEMLSPIYIKTLPKTDGWGHPFEFGLESADRYNPFYRVRSGGSDGRWDSEEYEEGTVTTSFCQDIVYSNGVFLQWPEGKQRH